MTESVIDFPKDSLCPQIWEKVMSSDGSHETFILKQEVEDVLFEVIDQIMSETKLHFNVIHITGSITSNSYTENADIDMHFLSDQYDVDEARAEQINKMIRAAYKKAFIGKHPIEVYFQPNKFQDLMSVGCYDFFNQKWLVGPELTDPSFNPYSEYYKEIQTKSEGLAQQIRNIILSTYEKAVVMQKNLGTELSTALHDQLVEKLTNAQTLYNNIRKMRKVFSSPESEQQALQYRSSKKWKIADASFKLFDKYGYMAILKKFVEDFQLLSSSNAIDEEIAIDILDTVKNYINNADKLAEKELFEDLCENDDKEYAYHVSNVPPEMIKKHGFKAGLGNGGTERNLFQELYDANYPKNYLFISKEPWDNERNEKFKYCYKIDVSKLDFYPDFGMLFDNGAYYEETNDDYLFYWKDKDIKFMKNKMLKAFLEEQNCEMTVNEMIGGETSSGEYFPDALYDALGSAVVDGDKVNKENRIVDVQTRYDEAEQIDEGAKEAISSFALALALLIPGVVNSQVLNRAQRSAIAQQVDMDKKQNEFENMLKDSNPQQMMNGYKMWQACNIIALTLYGEGRGEIRSGGLDPITDTIMNRTASTPDFTRAANICVGRYKSKAFQYSFWNNNKNALSTIKSGQPVLPNEIADNVIERKAWEKCLNRSVEIITGKYKVKDKNINSYHVTDMSNPPSWTKTMTHTKVVGKHTFGYVKSNDPTYTDMATITPVKKATMVKKANAQAAKSADKSIKTHVVKKGDTLTMIAKKNNTTAKKLAQKNGIKLNSILKIGQKIKI